MKKSIFTLLLACFSIVSFSQVVEEEEYAPMSKPSNPEQEQTSTQQNNQQASPRNSSFAQRLRYGGNLQLSFGTYTFIEVSPRVGYLVSEDFTAGLGLNYMYWSASSNAYYPGSPRYTSQVYGFNTFGMYRVPISLPIGFQAEFEMLNMDIYDRNTNESSREWVPGLYLGGGIFSGTGRAGAGVYAMALYNVLWRADRSLYASPWNIRIGVML